MKKTPQFRLLQPRLIVFFVLCTVLITIIDVLVHHHSVTALLPEFGMYVVLSLAGGLIFIVIALCLVPLISRKGDYYER